jgi:hypothetical protein
VDRQIDWKEKGVFKVERSDTFEEFGQWTVNIYRKDRLVLPDMSPSILVHCKFPELLCRAASLTAQDGKVRTIETDGSMTARTPLYIPPPKPKLIIPLPPDDKPKLALPEED